MQIKLENLSVGPYDEVTAVSSNGTIRIQRGSVTVKSEPQKSHSPTLNLMAIREVYALYLIRKD